MSDSFGVSKPSRLSNRNHILNNLPDEDFNRLLPNLKQVDLKLGQTIYHTGEPIEYVYFPHDSMGSVIAGTSKGETSEVGVIGYEGIIGIDVLLGGKSSINYNVTQIAGTALQIPVAAVKEEFRRAGAFHDLTLLFVRLMIVQISQTALCNRLHTVDERLARWLLMCRDRAQSDTLNLTQEFLAIMLGTQRATVTMSAIALQSTGSIKYSRGVITILDREGLEDFACDCYKTVKDNILAI